MVSIRINRNILLNRKLVILFLFLLSLMCSYLSASIVHAASVYDTAYQHTSTISTSANAFGNNCAAVDLTNTWSSYIANDPALSSSFKEAMENGSWAISQRTLDPLYWNEQYVAVFWTETANIELNFNHMFSSFYETRINTVDNSSAINFAYIRTNATGYTSANPCDIIVLNNGTVSEYQFTTNMTSQQAGLVDRGFLLGNSDINYPASYDGIFPSTGYAPQLVQGNVLCLNPNDTISAVNIDHTNGFDQNADLTNGPNASKDYAFRIWNESPYRIIVLCEGVPHYGPIIQDNPLTLPNELYSGQYGNYNWVCVEDQDQPYCYAS